MSWVCSTVAGLEPGAVPAEDDAPTPDGRVVGEVDGRSIDEPVAAVGVADAPRLVPDGTFGDRQVGVAEPRELGVVGVEERLGVRADQGLGWDAQQRLHALARPEDGAVAPGDEHAVAEAIDQGTDQVLEQRLRRIVTLVTHAPSPHRAAQYYGWPVSRAAGRAS